MRVTYAPAALDAPGPWTRFPVAGHVVYMRVDLDWSRVTARYGEGDAIGDLAVVCDMDQVGNARIMINPQQAAWASTDQVETVLLAQARTLWRRRRLGQTGNQLSCPAGGYVYDFWADKRSGRVELYRRPAQSGEVVIEEHLGYVGRFGAATVQVHLDAASEAIGNTMLCRVQALAGQCWRGDREGPEPGQSWREAMTGQEIDAALGRLRRIRRTAQPARRPSGGEKRGRPGGAAAAPHRVRAQRGVEQAGAGGSGDRSEAAHVAR